MTTGGPLTVARGAFACDGKALYFAEGSTVCFESLEGPHHRALLVTHPKSLVETIVATTATRKEVWPLLSAVADDVAWEPFRPASDTGQLKIVWSIVVSFSLKDGLMVTVHPLLPDSLPSPSQRVLCIENDEKGLSVIALTGNAQGQLVLAVKRDSREAVELHSLTASTLLQLAATAKTGKMKLEKVLAAPAVAKICQLPSLLLLAGGGSTIAALLSKSELAVIEKQSGHTKQIDLPGDDLELCALAVNPAGDAFCVADRNGRLIWAQTGELAPTNHKKGVKVRLKYHTQHWHDHALSALAFTPSGDCTLSAGEKGTLCVWSKINQSGMSRSTVQRLGAPVIGHLVVPCATLQALNAKAMEALRSLVVISLSSNALAVVDIARLEVVRMIEGISSPCTAPEASMLTRDRKANKRTSPQIAESAAAKLMRLSSSPGCVAHTTIFPRTDKYDADSCDVGQVDLLEVDPESLRLHVSGRLPYRNRLEWSRQGESQWQSFWRSRQVCLTPDMSALLVAESQKCEGKDPRHRLVFSTTSMESQDKLKACARVFVDNPVTSLCHIPAQDGLLFAVGFATGEVALYRWEKTDTFQTFSRILFQELVPGQRICEMQASAECLSLLVRNRVVTYKLPDAMSTACVIRLEDPISVIVATREKALATLRAGKPRETSLESVSKFLQFESRGVILGLHDAIELLPDRQDPATLLRHRFDPPGKHKVTALACHQKREAASLLIAVATSSVGETGGSLILLEYVDAHLHERRKVQLSVPVSSLVFLREGELILAVSAVGGWYAIEKTVS